MLVSAAVLINLIKCEASKEWTIFGIIASFCLAIISFKTFSLKTNFLLLPKIETVITFFFKYYCVIFNPDGLIQVKAIPNLDVIWLISVKEI